NLYQMRVDADAFRLQPEVIKPLNSDLMFLHYYTISPHFMRFVYMRMSIGQLESKCASYVLTV
ncbi:MAG: hypothetical protein IJR06_02675, partial [Paludibacteraceae bacterium]|nr:hypothetical protein [Paludibacteraceae bacterium]